MIIHEDGDFKKENLEFSDLCQCDELAKFYKKATHNVFPAIRYQEKDFKLEPLEVGLNINLFFSKNIRTLKSILTVVI